MRKRITVRTAERLRRAAYEYEVLLGALRAEGFHKQASSVAIIESLLCSTSSEIFEQVEKKGVAE